MSQLDRLSDIYSAAPGSQELPKLHDSLRIEVRPRTFTLLSDILTKANSPRLGARVLTSSALLTVWFRLLRKSGDRERRR